MQKLVRSAVSLLLVLVLCACGSGGSQWQEQYDLGTRYLNEGNYEEAVIAFTAAIEIDPKRVEAYVGAAQAYTAMGKRRQAAEILDKAESLLGENDAITAARDELDRLLPLNAYGAIEFAYRPDYVAYEDLSPEEQNWLSAAIRALERQDRDALLALCEQVTSINLVCCTTYEQYKVSVDAGPAGDNPSIHLEIRPENGMGYWCWTQIIENGYDHNIGSCPCVDWQWNGDAEYHREDYHPGNEHGSDLYEELESYPVVNNLRNGHGTETILWHYENKTSSENRTAEYSQGIKTASQRQNREDGSWEDLGSDEDFIYGVWCFGRGDPKEYPEYYYF